MKKSINPQVFLELVCYLIFATLMLYLCTSGKYQQYVTPKMVPYLYFSGIVMTIWTFAAATRLFKSQHRTRSAHCLVLAIPIMLIIMPHSSIQASDLDSGYITGNAFINSSNSTTDLNEISQKESKPDLISDQVNNTNESNLKKRIEISDDEFVVSLGEIYGNIEKYDGYEISMKGFVYKDSNTMQSDEFVPARLMMSCCSADLVPVGIIAKYDKAHELETDSWVMIEGIINIGDYMGNKEPFIIVKSIKPTEKPENEYIY